MSTGTLIAGLLGSIFVLLVYIALRIRTVFKHISDARIFSYTSHLNTLHDAMMKIKHGKQRPPMKDHQLDIVASFPTMLLSSEAVEAILNYESKMKAGASVSEIAAAEHSAEEKLVKLNVAMRQDLALNTGNGRFPNSEAFRAKRKKS